MTSLRLIAKRALSFPAKAVRGMRHVPTRWVLTFHEIGDHPWATREEQFEEILSVLRAESVVLPLADLLAAPESEALRSAITFDDGYLGVADRALPVLERAGVPATVFLPTDLLDEDDGLPRQDRGLYANVPLMGWSTVRRLATSSALRFESHGAAHGSLRSLSEDGRRDDLERSRDAIAKATGSAPKLLAYPFGVADRDTAAIAREVGFEAAFTTRHGGLRAGADPYLLPRADVRGEYTPRDVAAILKGDWDFLAWSQAVRGARA